MSTGGKAKSEVSSGGSAEEIDRILDKISASGYDSLSDAEKRRLVESSEDE
jgi:hypothetical protein